MSEVEDLKKILERLDLTPNEKEVYTALLISGPLNATEISDISGITKANVYPVIKRLVQKKFVDEQPTSRASKYKAIPPQDVMKELEDELQSRHKKEKQDLQEITALISKLDLNPAELKGSSPSDSVWLINSEARIKNGVLELLERATKSIIACIPTLDEPTYTKTRQEILELLEKTMKKKKGKMHLILNWELMEGTDDEAIANSLTKNGGSIYQWGLGELPFSAFLIDNSEGLIILQSVWIPIPQFGLALWVRHPAYVKPFEKLIQRFNEAGAFKKWG
ncbi:MAG: TrmB family transcriptional regulator [Candidatus Helarchaeota archaeon]|nr:TrmB family transcriptional regulator [Candidatus Helarchaeota archaeon]